VEWDRGHNRQCPLGGPRIVRKLWRESDPEEDWMQSIHECYEAINENPRKAASAFRGFSLAFKR
jgi:hypothetical protein